MIAKVRRLEISVCMSERADSIGEKPSVRKMNVEGAWLEGKKQNINQEVVDSPQQDKG